MRKQTLLAVAIMISAGLLLGGCGGENQESFKDSVQQTENSKSDSTNESTPEAKNEQSETKPNAQELAVPSSEKDLFAFMEG